MITQDEFFRWLEDQGLRVPVINGDCVASGDAVIVGPFGDGEYITLVKDGSGDVR